MRQIFGSVSPALAGLCSIALVSGATLAAELPSASPESVGMSSVFETMVYQAIVE